MLRVLYFAAFVYPDRDTVFFVLSPGEASHPVALKALCHPGDDSSLVLTVLLPTED
ncbi:MAG: hypothetical protein ACLQMF_05455 [Rectinemataceae bacterium]